MSIHINLQILLLFLSLFLLVLPPFPPHKQAHICTLHPESLGEIQNAGVRRVPQTALNLSETLMPVGFNCPWLILMSGFWCAQSLPTEFVNGIFNHSGRSKFANQFLADFTLESWWPRWNIAALPVVLSEFIRFSEIQLFCCVLLHVKGNLTFLEIH